MEIAITREELEQKKSVCKSSLLSAKVGLDNLGPPLTEPEDPKRSDARAKVMKWAGGLAVVGNLLDALRDGDRLEFKLCDDCSFNIMTELNNIFLGDEEHECFL